MKKRDHQLVQRVLDGDMKPDEFDEFQGRMRSEPELVTLYQEYALVHHTLSEEFEGGFPAEGSVATSTGRTMRVGVLVAAIAAVLAAVWWFVPWPSRGGDDVAAVTFSLDAVWRFEGTTRNLGGATGVTAESRLKLDQGRAAIALAPALSAVVEGPAEVVFSKTDSLHLEKGRGWFHRSGNVGPMSVTTPRLKAVDDGTEFGLNAPEGGPDEVHVRSGRVRVDPKSGGDSLWLAAGDALRLADPGGIERFAAEDRTFAPDIGRFEPLFTGPLVRDQWRIEYGNPVFSGSGISGANFSAFRSLGGLYPAGDRGVLLVTIDVGKPEAGAFHTDGWAGMSFFSQGNEVLFFGDSFGTRSTWSLDVKQRIPVILPETPVVGPRVVTLRYEVRTGEVSLHDGSVPLAVPFCRGKLPAGTRFDEIRVGASAGAALAVDSLLIRSGG